MTLRSIALSLLLFVATASFAGVSDTIHIRKYVITVDNVNYSAKTISANALLSVYARMDNVQNLSLSLLQMTVDSVWMNGVRTPHNYNGNAIRIAMNPGMMTGDSALVKVFYRGSPKQDASGWGGFYWSGTYAFNMGVGFAANPHSFAKVWYPCVDEFTDKSLYDFHVTTQSGYKAFCNGMLQSVTTNTDGSKTWFWRMNQAIPSYLASIAVAPFYTMKGNHAGIPVEWAVMPADSVKTKNTFVNLGSAVNTFLNSYGPHRWDKLGFICIPFSSGAMEHATSIHIGKPFIDGSLTYETLWAHEFAHHWWGDLVTCETEGDMWLNEGMASFSEALFLEGRYGTVRYKDHIRSQHRRVLQFAHIDDGNYLSLVNVPHAYTYGTTVYNKGADIAHTLRKYMGDSSYFKGCRDYMNNRAFGNANSYDFSNELTQSSGKNMTVFFNDWVMTQGFPFFTIDSVVSVPAGGGFDLTLYGRQKQKGNNHIYTMPVECTLSDGVKDTVVTLVFNAATNVFKVSCPFDPKWITLDRDEKVSDAVSDYEKNISTIGIHAFSETGATLDVQTTGSGASLVRVEHNWVQPDGFQGINPGIRLSDYHYWKVSGLLSQGFHSKATFTYDGSTSTTTGYIDNTLLLSGQKEDSMVIMYRRGAGDEWRKVNGYVLNKGASAVDRKGSVTVDTLKAGEYVFGMKDASVATWQQDAMGERMEGFSLTASPNPVKDICTLRFRMPAGSEGTLSVYDATGREVHAARVYSHQEFVTWDTWKKTPGLYLVRLTAGGHEEQVRVLVAGE
jgi:aminopeptidase N